MESTIGIYGKSMALLTDLYSLTMAQSFWKEGLHETEVSFHAYFRANPFKGGYAIAAGLGLFVDFIKTFHFDDSDIQFLRTVNGSDGQPLFEEQFLQYLAELRFSADVDAVPEGTAVFPFEPILRIKGSVLQAVLFEGLLLNCLNFSTLVATKAARISYVTKNELVIEFGLRRAQGIDGALTATRAAYIGGVSATSNVLAAKLFGIPVKGTHAHCWVMFFGDELDAFKRYARAMPNNSLFLVDTYDTLLGVKNAIAVGRWLKKEGHKFLGVRLDSGDLGWLSIKARKLLDEAGFKDAAIVGSNDLDERLIESIKHQGGVLTVWGVGTKLVTAYDQPALGGVWKIGAVKAKDESWEYRLKASENPIKTSIPGILQVRRFYNQDGTLMCDAIYDEIMGPDEISHIIDPMNSDYRRGVSKEAVYEDLLKPIFRNGRFVGEHLSLEEARARTLQSLAGLDGTVLRHDNPHTYKVGLSPNLFALRQSLIVKARGLERWE